MQHSISPSTKPGDPITPEELTNEIPSEILCALVTSIAKLKSLYGVPHSASIQGQDTADWGMRRAELCQRFHDDYNLWLPSVIKAIGSAYSAASTESSTGATTDESL